MKKAISLLLIFCLCAMALAAPAYAYEPDNTYAPTAQSIYIVNTDTNVIVYNKNEAETMPAEGLTKLMTAAVVLTDFSAELDTRSVTMTNEMIGYIRGSDNADIRTGETLSVRQLLSAMLIYNANEAAQGLAYTLGGNSSSTFVARMNELAAAIGCTGTNYTEACGFSGSNTTTAVDTYLLLRYLMQFDVFVEIMGTYTYALPPNYAHASQTYLNSYNKTLNRSDFGDTYYRSYMQGGLVSDRGNEETQSFAGWATKDGCSYICVVMEVPAATDQYPLATTRPGLYETVHLLDWVYASLAVVPALDVNQPLCELPVLYSSERDTVLLYPQEAIYTVLPVGSDTSVTQKVFHMPEQLEAPLRSGQQVGSVTLYLAGQEIGQANLVVWEEIEVNNVLYTLSQLGDFMHSTYVKVLLVLLLLAALLYAAWFIYIAVVRSHGRHRR